MRASCLPSIALPQSLTVFALIAASLWRYRPLSVSVIGMCTARHSCWILSGVVYISVTSAYQRVRPCDFGFMMRLWNRLSCTSAAEPERLIARGAITSSILLVKIIVQLCVFLCASVCVCVSTIHFRWHSVSISSSQMQQQNQHCQLVVVVIYAHVSVYWSGACAVYVLMYV